MYRVVKGSPAGLADVAAFLDTLAGLASNPREEIRTLFDPRRGIIVTRAPGRLDVLGGIADYSGSRVLEMPIREATLVAIQTVSERTLRVVSHTPGSDQARPAFDLALGEFDAGGTLSDYACARDWFRRDPNRAWAAYVAGVFLVLIREQGRAFPAGARVLVHSSVPQGQGVSSSAALEVAVMQAVTTAFDHDLPPNELARLCQTVENRVVGAPCGIMDQMTAALGRPDQLLALLCQPAIVEEYLPVPAGLRLWGLSSGVRHAVAGNPYHAARVGAFMGYRIIAGLAGLAAAQTGRPGRVSVRDPLWSGFLANVPLEQFANRFRAQLPARLSGGEFLQRYTGITDPVTHVDPDIIYPVQAATAFPIEEHDRIRRCTAWLRETADRSGPAHADQPSAIRELETLALQLGGLLYASHAGYSACGLGSAETDLLVDLVRTAGPAQGMFGARITGGGSGGTVIVLGWAEAEPAIAGIAQEYAQATGRTPHLYRGSSPGAAQFGHVRLEPADPVA